MYSMRKREVMEDEISKVSPKVNKIIRKNSNKVIWLTFLINFFLFIQ